jgi:structure-specific recognition protein 1
LIDVIRTIAQVVLIAPDPKDFKSRGGQSCVKCGVKTQTGWLYFLKKSLIFIMKPVLYFKTEDILKVEFHRLGANNKQFDLKVMLNIEKAKPI